MENLEDVLQALDEFQKMRPTEIPRELEEYLCWVAKTGDPVYQWSLIKTLFREKLTRVMTDFYESCPSLDLTPCPNVEHFNYDTMKSNLLERLESFANAPFTVQRICELLTAPRKEYNRVDKFMRAIEKNILVVSTREPGPIGRRNENGDGMVNGSIDEDTSVTEPPQDVEMEYWEKDCPSTVTLSVHTVENETPLLHTVVPTATVVKNVFDTDGLSQEKAESASSKSDTVVSNFIPTASEFSNVPNLNSQTEIQEPHIGSTIQNLSTIVPETSGIVSDVSEAIMNEDTSSQPSLEMDNEGSDAVDPSRKLQTTFQTKDFALHENKSRFYADNSKVSDKLDIGVIQAQDESSKSNDTLVKTDLEPEIALDNKEIISPIVENFLSANDNLEDAIKPDIELGCARSIINTSCSSIEHKETLESENVQSTSGINNLEESTSNLILPTNAASIKETMNVSHAKTEENFQEQSKEAESTENSKPIVEEPCSKDDTIENLTRDQEKESFSIIEATEDETTVIKSIVPDPIPIVEEPKNIETIDTKEDVSPIMEIREDHNSSVICQSESTERMPLEDNSTDQQTNDITVTINNIKGSETKIETDISNKELGTTELMDVDEEETLSVFQQNDEPMEQETAQSSES